MAGNETATAKKRKRPYGACYSRSVRVRFPPEVDSALRQARRLFGVSISDMVRTGVLRALTDQIPEAISRIRDTGTSDRKKLNLLTFMRTLPMIYLAFNEPKMMKEFRKAKFYGFKTPPGNAPGRIPHRKGATKGLKKTTKKGTKKKDAASDIGHPDLGKPGNLDVWTKSAHRDHLDPADNSD